MHGDDLFEERGKDGFGMPKLRLRAKLLNDLRSGVLPDHDDLDCAIALTRLVHAELEACGTGGFCRLDDPEIEIAQRTLRSVLDRHGLSLDLPWRNFEGFKSYWLKMGARNSYQARRDILDGYFEPIETALHEREHAQFREALADPVSPHGSTGWPRVDEEVSELRRRFRTASTPQDYRDVGNLGVAVLEALSRVVYDPAKHLREGECVPAVDKTKMRLERYVEDSLGGKDNKGLRGVATSVIVLAHGVKHSETPTRREAGITADAVVLLANILRRVEQDD